MSRNKQSSYLYYIITNNYFLYTTLYMMFYIMLVCVLPEHSGLVDLHGFWDIWSAAIFEHGVSQVYNFSDCNYPPLYIYLLKMYTLTQSSKESIFDNIIQLKAYFLVFDFIGAISILLLLPKKERNPIYPFFFLFNIAFIYNSYIWGQNDAILAALVFFAFIALIKEKNNLGVVFYCLALSFKAQAIIFLPPFVIILLVQIPKNKSAFLKASLSGLLTFFVVFLPFILSGEFGTAVNVIFNSVDFYPSVSMNAFNVWDIFFRGADLIQLSDQERIFGIISYKTLGLMMFFTCSLIALLPLGLTGLNKIFKKEAFDSTDLSLIILSTGLIPIIFFYFNTQMHERYSHPALLFLGAYAFIKKRPLLYIICSLAYLLNMEAVCHFWTKPMPVSQWDLPLSVDGNHGHSHGLSYHRPIISIIYLSVIILGIWDIYRSALVSLLNPNNPWRRIFSFEKILTRLK